ncbi:hypothetical protein [Kibdelosporangium philippinense]|uniref:hypothetical protein n=1 Tax=Kibdelosporangium philippinense TaxID=211113 RepID=UPI003606FDB7
MAAVLLWRSGPMVRVRSEAAYRVRKIPQDVARLVWFVLRGNWRWLVKFWTWATYADLRADARRARACRGRRGTARGPGVDPFGFAGSMGQGRHLSTPDRSTSSCARSGGNCVVGLGLLGSPR